MTVPAPPIYHPLSDGDIEMLKRVERPLALAAFGAMLGTVVGLIPNIAGVWIRVDRGTPLDPHDLYLSFVWSVAFALCFVFGAIVVIGRNSALDLLAEIKKRPMQPILFRAPKPPPAI